MADNPQNAGRERPLSPHLTIWRWQVTMFSSILHRASGCALAGGSLVLAWWLVSISNGPEGYDSFMAYASMPLGLLVLFGLAWSLAYHFCNGVRHLAWDIGYGFGKKVSSNASFLVIGISLLIVLGVFALFWTGQTGYLQK